MTAGTVVITGGILATVILLLIIAVLCYCRLQYYCCKKEESESEEEEPDFAVTSRLPPVHSNHNIVAATAAASSIPNGPALFSTPPMARKLTRSQTFCPSCTHYELPFYLQPPQPQVHHQPDGLRNGGDRISGDRISGDRISYRSVKQQDLELPVPVNITNYRKPNLARSVTMRDMFTRSVSISTDV
ncbi:protein FAM163B-like [Neosynchiropus ocellatus]